VRASIRGAGAARGAPAEQEAKQMLIAREGGRAACAVGNSGHHPCHGWIPVRSLEARGSGRRYASAQGPASRLPSGPVGAKGTKVLALNGKEAFGHVLGLRLGIDFHALIWFGLLSVAHQNVPSLFLRLPRNSISTPQSPRWLLLSA
jgi:hypothetical protein